MKTLMPSYIGLSFLLLLVQAYLLFYAALLLLRRLKLLKQPYSGMDYSEVLSPAVILFGVLLISSANALGLFQAAKSFNDMNAMAIGKPLLLFFVKSFLVILLFSILYIVLSFLNIRLLFRRYYLSPDLVTGVLLCIIAIGIAFICWFTCREVIDGQTPKFINFR